MATSIKATIEGLDQIDQARKKRGWTKRATSWCHAAGYLSGSTLDRFWARKPILQEYFVAICMAVGIEDWEAIADLTLSKLQTESPVFSNYDEQTWSGRETLVNDLLPRLQGKTRLLWMTGISGIGKTALGECLASRVWEADPSFQWIYLEVLEGQSKDFASVAADLLARLGDRNLDPQERNNPEHIAKRLLQKLQSQRYWLQLDALERLLNPEQPTEFVDAYWVTFLQRCLTEASFASRLVLTAQAFPTALVEFGDRYPNVWTEIQLGGLMEVDQRIEFFSKRGVVVKPPNQESLTCIAQIYEGHPLVLKVIAEDILQEFAGDVLQYWQVNQREFEQVARELQDARLDETEYNEALDRKVRERIRKSIEQLPPDALDLLCRSSVFRRPVLKNFWLAMIEDRSTQEQKVAYRVLRDRALIEKEGIAIRQHNLIRSVAYDMLKADLQDWETIERRAAEIWLTDEPASDTSSSNQMVNCLEAFYHSCEAKDWETAEWLFNLPCSTPDGKPLYIQLGTWGFYYEQIILYQSLFGKINAITDSICLRGLGEVFHWLGDYSRSIDYYQEALSLAQTSKDSFDEGAALIGLGMAYIGIGEFLKAIDLLQKSLEIATQVSDRDFEGKALGNLGDAYTFIGNYHQACDCWQQWLSIARETQAHNEEGRALGGLAAAHASLGKCSLAIEYYQQSVEILRQVGDRLGEGRAFAGLGIAHISLGNYAQAMSHLQESQLIASEIGDMSCICTVLSLLGDVYLTRGHCQQAIEHYLQSLEISEAISDPSGASFTLGRLGGMLHRLGEYEQAMECYQQHLTIAREIGNRSSEGSALANLGNLNQSLGKYEQAMEYYQQHLKIMREIGERSGESVALGNLGSLYRSLGKYEQAIEYHQQHLTIAREIGNRSNEGYALGNLGSVYYSLDKHNQAVSYHQQHLTIMREIIDFWGEGIALCNLGETQIAVKQYTEALENLNTSLDIFCEIDSRAEQSKALKNLADLYQQVGETTIALEYCQRALVLATELDIPLKEECEALKLKIENEELKGQNAN